MKKKTLQMKSGTGYSEEEEEEELKHEHLFICNYTVKYTYIYIQTYLYNIVFCIYLTTHELLNVIYFIFYFSSFLNR